MKKPGLSKLEEDRLNKRMCSGKDQKLFLIFTEGTKTEPYYFEGFKKAIEESRQDVLVEIIGVGQAGTSLLRFAKNFVEKHEAKNASVWIVSDKDDNPDRAFNDMIRQTEKLNQTRANRCTWKCAWSNECFELWFLLHFSFYQPAAKRFEYFRLLKKEFSKRGAGRYEKNMENIFELLCQYGDPKRAVKYAEMLYEEKRELPPGRARPCTTVFELVLELARFLPQPLRSRFFAGTRKKQKNGLH